MGICMLGIDHNRALLDVRALFSFTKKNTAEALEVLREKEGILGWCHARHLSR